MSLAATRLALKHRVTVERDANADAGDWGDPDTPDWQPHLTDLPCRAWSSAGRETVDAKTTVIVEDMRLLCQLGTDITAEDRLGDITSRGTVIFAGPIGVRAVLARPDHLELVLVRL